MILDTRVAFAVGFFVSSGNGDMPRPLCPALLLVAFLLAATDVLLSQTRWRTLP